MVKFVVADEEIKNDQINRPVANSEKRIKAKVCQPKSQFYLKISWIKFSFYKNASFLGKNLQEFTRIDKDNPQKDQKAKRKVKI